LPDTDLATDTQIGLVNLRVIRVKIWVGLGLAFVKMVVTSGERGRGLFGAFRFVSSLQSMSIFVRLDGWVR
jgi:hypothetical protein